jgi:hypothetical protein
MTLLTIIIAIFFYFFFMWAFRLVVLILLARVIQQLKERGQKRMEEWMNGNGESSEM